MKRYFDDASVHQPVYSLKKGIGVITSIQESRQHGLVLTIRFGALETTSFYFSANGCLIDINDKNPSQDLFYPDDKSIETQGRLRFTPEMKKIIERDGIKDQPECRSYRVGIPNIYDPIFDLVYGWGRVISISEDGKLVNVHFHNHGLRRTYDWRTRAIVAEGTPLARRLFTAKEVIDGKIHACINKSIMDGKTAPFTVKEVEVKSNPDDAAESKDTMYLFAYQPKGAEGYLQNIMIGTASGKSVEEAFACLHHPGKRPETRMDKLVEAYRRGRVDHVFAYEVKYISAWEKDMMRGISNYFTQHSNSVMPVDALVQAAIDKIHGE
jgi:hypothetical protein